ncbi:MAG: DoxX family membrane protein [Chloroflexi bacterium]|nr:DoxX family membrane protein [Chloroflexota bacterium]
MDHKAKRLLAIVRIALGWTFLWAFVDKLFGLGLGTAAENAWLAGGSPTAGFLKFGTAGPLAGVYAGIAGHPLVDGLFMFGLLALGVALILGLGMRLASHAGALLMLLMWSAHLPPTTNPLVDSHIIYALVLLVLGVTQAGHTWGLGRWWEQQVQRLPILK